MSHNGRHNQCFYRRRDSVFQGSPQLSAVEACDAAISSTEPLEVFEAGRINCAYGNLNLEGAESYSWQLARKGR